MSKIQKLTLAGLLVAIDIIAARFLSFYLPFGTQLVRVGPQFLAHSLAGWLLGPFWALGSAVAGDLLGMLINAAGKTIYPGYTISAALTGLIYGLLLYRRPVRLWRCLLAVSLAVIGVSTLLTSYWNSLYFSVPWLPALWSALPWRLITIPIYTALLFAVQKGLVRAKVIDT